MPDQEPSYSRGFSPETYKKGLDTIRRVGRSIMHAEASPNSRVALIIEKCIGMLQSRLGESPTGKLEEDEDKDNQYFVVAELVKPSLKTNLFEGIDVIHVSSEGIWGGSLEDVLNHNDGQPHEDAFPVELSDSQCLVIRSRLTALEPELLGKDDQEVQSDS